MVHRELSKFTLAVFRLRGRQRAQVALRVDLFGLLACGDLQLTLVDTALGAVVVHGVEPRTVGAAAVEPRRAHLCVLPLPARSDCATTGVRGLCFQYWLRPPFPTFCPAANVLGAPLAVFLNSGALAHLLLFDVRTDADADDAVLAESSDDAFFVERADADDDSAHFRPMRGFFELDDDDQVQLVGNVHALFMPFDRARQALPPRVRAVFVRAPRAVSFERFLIGCKAQLPRLDKWGLADYDVRTLAILPDSRRLLCLVSAHFVHSLSPQSDLVCRFRALVAIGDWIRVVSVLQLGNVRIDGRHVHQLNHANLKLAMAMRRRLEVGQAPKPRSFNNAGVFVHKSVTELRCDAFSLVRVEEK